MRYTKDRLIEMASKGCYLYDSEYPFFSDLDGTASRHYLERKGFNVVANYDTGRNGLAVTDVGLTLSTNGWLCIRRFDK